MAYNDDIEALRNAKPSFLSTPNRNASGLSKQDRSFGPFVPSEPQSRHSQFQADFPVVDDAVVADTSGSTNANEYSFELEVKQIDPRAYTIDIHVGYGEINDTPPDGMTGADDYVLTIAGAADGTEIWAVVTYDPNSLAITSRSLNFGFTVPDSTLTSTIGTLYIPIGFVDINYNSRTGAITSVDPHNRQCGDINIAFIYGAVNGAAGIFFLPQYVTPIQIPFS